MKYLLAFLSIVSGIWMSLLLQQYISPVPYLSKSTEIHTEILPFYLHPYELEIPQLKINTFIVPVGIDEHERMDVPKSFENVGWFKYGSIPGEQGNAVIAGHLDSPTGPAIFYNLNTLQIGDFIHVLNIKGEKMTFIIKEKKIYNTSSFPIEKVFGYTDKKILNIITCDGAFDHNAKTYDKRLVLVSQLINFSEL